MYIGNQQGPYTNFMDMSPLIPLDELHSHPPPSHSPSSHPKNTSDSRNLRSSLTPDEEIFDPYNDASSSSNFQPSIRPQLFYQRPTIKRRGILIRGAWQLAKTFLVPVITIAYLSFCYTVQYRLVPFSQGLYDTIDDTWIGMKLIITIS